MGLKEQREAAEQLFGVHEVYKDALSARQGLESALQELGANRKDKRTLELAIADRETEVTQETWSKNSDAPVTKLEKIVKVEVQSDGLLRDFRKKLAEIISDIESLEHHKEMHETDIKIACARMNELGGHLNMIAALTAKEKGNG